MRRLTRWLALMTFIACTFTATSAHAAGGPLGIDHQWNLDQRGIWSRGAQTGLEAAVVAVELGGAFALGNDREFGHTMFQALDASAISTASAYALKRAFSRARPYQQHDPDRWFQGSCCNSFPSGEVTLQASFVTPIIIHYASDHPWVWALEALPLYDSVARMKAQAHWQTDVLAGWALGTGIGYWTSTFRTPFTVQILPHGATAGFIKRF